MKTSTREQLLHDITYKPSKRLELLSAQSAAIQASLISALSPHIQRQITSKLDQESLVAILEHLDPDHATDILQLLPAKTQKALLTQVNQNLKEEITFLLAFDPKTAAGLMNLDYVQVDIQSTIADVIERLEDHESRTGRIATVLVLDQERLAGIIPTARLPLAKPHQSVRDHLKKIPTINHHAKHHQVINLFRHHPHNKAAVLGEKGNVVGIIYSDDVLKLLHDQASASLYDFAGVSTEETLHDSARRKIRFRYKWLMLNLATAFLAATTVGLFEETLAKHVILAVYMPIVAGMGGNAGTQTLAVLVRGLSNSPNIPRSVVLNTLINELGSGLFNGLLNGTIVTLIVWLINGNLLIGLVLGAAMVINLLVASLFGTLVPVMMKSLGKDPASSATILISTATDVFGFIAFLGLATLMLG